MTGWRSVNVLFLITTTLESLAMGHLTAFTPLLLGQELGLDSDAVGLWTGLLFGAMMAVAFPLAPFWGALAERYSRRLIIVRSQYFEAAGYALMAFAPDVWWLLGSRILLGLTFGNIAVVIATQTLLTPRRHIGSAIALIQVAAPIAASLGPPIGAGLIGVIGLRGLFLLDAGATLLAALLVTFLMPEPTIDADRRSSILGRAGETMRAVWQRRTIRWNFGAWFFSQGARVIVDVYLPLRIAQLVADPAPAIGLILGIYGLLTAIATWLSARLVDDTGGIRWFLPAMIAATLATVGLALATDLRALALLAWSRALPFAASQTLLYGHLARVLPPQQQTSVMSLTPMPRNVAAFVLPLLAAALAPISVAAALGVGAASYAGTAVMGWLLTRSTRDEQAGRHESGGIT